MILRRDRDGRTDGDGPGIPPPPAHALHPHRPPLDYGRATERGLPPGPWVGGWRSRPAPPPDAAIGHDRTGGPAVQCASRSSQLSPDWAAPGDQAQRPQVGAGRAGPKPGSLGPGPAATPSAHSHSISARGWRWARWTRRCSPACWKPTAAWRWPESSSRTAGRWPWTPRVGGRRADPGGAGSFPARSERLEPTPNHLSEPRSALSVARSPLLLQRDLGPDRDVLAPQRRGSPGGEAVPRALQRHQVQHHA